ncbi:MAG: diaminopimelate epimerase [Rikenellaceae bacterium]|jgi:diaminopimelate epimerase|nr:diaminopimelate epimerase [Rikenellaceae bacterium]
MIQKFYKYHGAGNDFVLMDSREGGLQLTSKQIATLCDRRFAIGADGFMSLENDPQGTEFYMRYYNADGSQVAMCGNGGRCIALFAHHLGIGGRLKTFRGMDGLHTAEILETQGNAGRVRIQMIDVPGLERHSDYLFLNTGVPHYVAFTDRVDGVDVVAEGRKIRHAEAFASRGGTNVNFVETLPDGSLKIRTYERGVENETLACGTGATAAAIAAGVLHDPDQKAFTVHARGGDLRVTFEKGADGGFQNIFLEGSAVKVFACELNLDEIFSE